MPASVYHVYTNQVADGTATSVVRPSDWNSNHAITLAPSGAEIIGAFSNSPTVTFGTNTAGYVTASAAGGGGGGGGVAISAGTNSTSTGTVAFADSNGVSFGMNTNGVITGTVATNYQSQGAYLTTAMQSDAGSNFVATSQSSGFAGTGFTSTTTNGSQLVGTVGTNGVSLGVPAWVTAAGAGDGNNVIGVNGNATQASTTYVFSNGNNVSFGLNAGTITASASYAAQTVDTNKAGTGFTSTTTAGAAVVGTLNTNGLSLGIPAYLTTYAAQTVQPVAYSAGNGSANFSTLKFADSQGVSFSTGTQGVFATVKTDYLTTAAQSNHSHGNPTLALTNINGTTASASNGLTLSLSAVVPAQTVQPVAYSAANGSANFSTLTFANSNGVSFSTGTQGLYATVKTDYQSSNANYLTTQTNPAVSAANGSSTFQTLTFANSNGVSFSTGTQGIYATVATNYQSQGAYLTTARASNDAVGLNTAVSNVTATINSSGISLDGRGYAGTGTSATNASITLNSNGLAISIGAGGAADGYNSAQFTNSTANSTMPLLWAGNSNGSGNVTVGLTGSTITMSAPSGGGGGVAISAGANSQSTGTVIFSNSNNVTFGLNAGTVTASASYPSQTVQPVAYSAANGSANFSTLTFANSNGVSFSTGTQGVYATVATNYQSQGAYLTTARASNDAVGLNTAATNVTWTVNSSGISLNAGAYLTTARASNDAIGLNTALTANGVSVTANSSGLSLNFPAFLTTAALSNHSHGNPTLALTNITGTTASASNGLTLSLSGVAAQTTQTQPAGNIAGVGTTFAGANLSGSMTLNSNGLNLSMSAAAPGGGGAINVSAGTTSGNLQTIQFDNANGVSFGLNGSTVTASVNAGAGGGTTVSWYPPLPLPIATSSMVTGTSGNTGGSFQTTAAMYIGPMQLNQALSFGEVELIASHGALSAGTGSITIGHQVGIYSLNGGTALSRVSSFEWNCVLSQNSATAITAQFWWGTNSTSNSTGITGNSSASVTGPRVIKLYDSTGSLPPGDYWVAQCMTHRSSSVNIASGWFTGAFLSQSQSTLGASYFGNSTVGQIMRHIGSVTTTQNNANSLVFQMPVSIHTSAITNSGGTSQQRVPVVRFYV